MFLSYHKLGKAHEAPRVFLESSRLARLGFAAGTPYEIATDGLNLTLRPSLLSSRIVSRRKLASCDRPVIDLNSHSVLGRLADYDFLKAQASFGTIKISPSVRAFNILKNRTATGTLRVCDVFVGGGTKSAATKAHPAFKVTAGIEIEPTHADEFEAKNPEATVIVGDFRHIDPSEIPDFEILSAGIPCTDHSNQGRAKKGLAGRPELGEAGDLYIPVLGLIAAKMPLAVVLENVPGFGTSLAGQTVVANMRRLGYEATEYDILPNDEWNEPTTRDRWVCIACLRQGFKLQAPGVKFSGRVGSFFDAPNAEQDRADAERIAKTIAGLRVHNARHAALGHGFAIKVLTGDETAAPTICKSYHKINSSGFFVDTPFGPRQLRKGEVERLHGVEIINPHYATAIEMIGQGILGRVFSEIFRQLGNFLT